MTCIPAPACKALLAEANALAPNRNKLSDGICASSKHTAQNPNSDHETGDAVDLTDDKPNGCDADALVAHVIARRDPRIKYIIANRHIIRSYDKPGIPAWTWATYTGPNPHEKHRHFSIHAAARNDTSPWFQPGPPPIIQENDMTKDEHDALMYAKDQAEGARYRAEEVDKKLDRMANVVDLDALVEKIVDKLAQRLES